MAIKGYYVINTVIKIRKEMTQGKNKTEFHLSMNLQNLKKKKKNPGQRNQSLWNMYFVSKIYPVSEVGGHLLSVYKS